VILYPTFKRVLDVLAAGILLIATVPLSFYAAYRVKSEDGGPVLYAAPRVGLGGVPFRMYKFRSMVVNAASIGGSSTASDDPRLTETGTLLRKWKLDELPQLLNVLRGEMSLVGPRPQVQSDVDRYTTDERRLLSVKPGITDWASNKFSDEGAVLAGHADPDEAYDRLIRPEKIRLGLRYVEQQSLATDMRILYSTAAAVLRRPGVPK
jgi:lipopolysaccharide/colanic/teichoic acid biosynthesis glycosyltransferase